MPLLFSYGTLQQQSVQLAVFGRKLSGTPDSLVGYALSMIPITDADVIRVSGKTHHPIVMYADNSNARVSGTVFDVTELELHLVDQYEVSAYRRIAASLASGRMAWVYVDSEYTQTLTHPTGASHSRDSNP